MLVRAKLRARVQPGPVVQALELVADRRKEKRATALNKDALAKAAAKDAAKRREWLGFQSRFYMWKLLFWEPIKVPLNISPAIDGRPSKSPQRWISPTSIVFPPRA